MKLETFQLLKKLANFARFFPISLGSFQLRWVLSNFSATFQLSNLKLSNLKLSNLKLSNFSFFPTALSNYTYPFFLVAWFSVTFGYEFSIWNRLYHIVYIISFQNRKSCSVTKYGSLWINVSLKNGNKLIQKALEVRGMTIENCICALSQFCD